MFISLKSEINRDIEKCQIEPAVYSAYSFSHRNVLHSVCLLRALIRLHHVVNSWHSLWGSCGATLLQWLSDRWLCIPPAQELQASA